MMKSQWNLKSRLRTLNTTRSENLKEKYLRFIKVQEDTLLGNYFIMVIVNVYRQDRHICQKFSLKRYNKRKENREFQNINMINK